MIMEAMNKNKRIPVGVGTVTRLLLLMVLTVTSPARACPSDGGDCRNCIANRMKTDCPKCRPIMRCMAQCLWGGTEKTKCVKKCNCNRGYPRLSDCKNCLSQCKCSCAAY